MSARIGMAVAMAYILRRKRKADPPHAAYLTDLPVPPRPFDDAHRESDAPDLLDDEPAEAAPEPEAAVKPARRCRSCGYVKGSPSCLIACGDGAR